MRSAVDVNAVASSFEECVGDLRRSAIEREVTSELHRSLCFVPIGAARSLEFETAIVGNVHLLVRVIDQKCVHAEAEAAAVRRCPELIEVGRSQSRLVGALDHTPCVDTIDPPAVIGVQSKWSVLDRRERSAPFALPSAAILEPAGVWVNA